MQNEKRQLETAFVVETKLGGKHQHRPVPAGGAGADLPCNASEQSDSDLEDDRATNEECGSRLTSRSL